jgi:hypothetical protein
LLPKKKFNIQNKAKGTSWALNAILNLNSSNSRVHEHAEYRQQTKKHRKPAQRKQQDCLTGPHPLANTANSTGLDSAIISA